MMEKHKKCIILEVHLHNRDTLEAYFCVIMQRSAQFILDPCGWDHAILCVQFSGRHTQVSLPKTAYLHKRKKNICYNI